jgi:hypothetical protein
MACACNGKKQNVDYVITYKHDGSTETVSSLPEARIKLQRSPQGGTHKAVARK